MNFLDLKEIFITFETSNNSSEEYINELELSDDMDKLIETVAMWKHQAQGSLEVATKYINNIVK